MSGFDLAQGRAPGTLWVILLAELRVKTGDGFNDARLGLGQPQQPGALFFQGDKVETPRPHPGPEDNDAEHYHD